MSDGMPSTFAGCLDNIAEWLDAVDDYLRTYGPAKEHGIPSGDQAQTDLRRLARNLRVEAGLAIAAGDIPIDVTLMKMMTEE